MLLLNDRGFDSDEFLARCAATGAQLLVRLDNRRTPAKWAHLSDGSYLTRIRGVRLRVIDAQVTATVHGGVRITGHYRLATTLLDHHRYPAAELVTLYRERWEIESAFYALRHSLASGLVLRSHDPLGVQQEVWAQLVVYQALRRAMAEAAESEPGTDPDRAAFTAALEAARDQVVAADGILPDLTRPLQTGRIGRAVLDNRLSGRRPRIAPRRVKCPVSRYANPPDQSRLRATARMTGITVTVHQSAELAPEGRRDRTLQLMRADPGRARHATEVAKELGLPHHRSLTGELIRWEGEGILRKVAPVTYILAPEWAVPDRLDNHPDVVLTSPTSP